MGKTTHELLASTADLLTRAVRRGLPFGPKTVTVTFHDTAARAVAIALNSIVGKPAERVGPVDACRNWAGTCDIVCDSCRDAYLEETRKRQAKFAAECESEGFDPVRGADGARRTTASNKAEAIMADGRFDQPVGWESPEEHDLEQAAFRMAHNRELPEEARKLIADLWRQYCFAAAPDPTEETEDRIVSAYAEAAAADPI